MVFRTVTPLWTGPLPGHVPPGQRMVITRNLTRLNLSQVHPCPRALRHFDGQP
jgi:hypothetical protein